MEAIEKMNDFVRWHRKIQNVHPLTNKTFDNILNKFNYADNRSNYRQFQKS